MLFNACDDVLSLHCEQISPVSKYALALDVVSKAFLEDACWFATNPERLRVLEAHAHENGPPTLKTVLIDLWCKERAANHWHWGGSRDVESDDAKEVYELFKCLDPFNKVLFP